MKLICEKNKLLSGLNIVSRAVPSKTTMSILQSVVIDAMDGIKLVSNDMELGIETVVEGDVEENGQVAVDARLFVDIIRKLPNADVKIKVDDAFKVNISCGKAKFNLPGRSVEEFTFLPVVNSERNIEISRAVFKNLVQQTVFSLSPNDANQMMTGELMEIKNGLLKMVALDGHRIALREESVIADDNSVIIPGKSLLEVSRIISDGMGDISIGITDKHVTFTFDKTKIVSRLIDGKYFDVDNMLSATPEIKVKVNRHSLMDCIDRATLLVREGDKKPVVFNVTDDGMEIQINSTVGSMNETLEIEKQGEDIMIGFNPKFVLDVLKAVEEDEVDLYFVNAKAPCFIKNDGYTYLILPINFK